MEHRLTNHRHYFSTLNSVMADGRKDFLQSSVLHLSVSPQPVTKGALLNHLQGMEWVSEFVHYRVQL